MIAYESVGKLDTTSHIGWTHLCLQSAMDWEATSVTFAGFDHMFERGLPLGWVQLEWLSLASLVSHIPPAGKPWLILIASGHGWDLEPQNWHIATPVSFFWANWVTTSTQIWIVGNVSTAGWEKLQNHIEKYMETWRGRKWGYLCILSPTLHYLNFLTRNSKGLINICKALKTWILLYQHASMTSSLHRASQLCT